MNSLKNKIDFVAIVCAANANPNGDPLGGNLPRTTIDGFGEISDVCIKRKIRNRMQDMGYSIFVQSDERCSDSYTSLSKRASGVLGKLEQYGKTVAERKQTYGKKACETWLDTRSFGQVFAFDDKKKRNDADESDDGDSVSASVRGPVSIHMARSVAHVHIHTMQITKSVNGVDGPKKSSDTMGKKHMIDHGLYIIKGSINVQLAEKTGFSEEDAEVLKECLRTLFVNDASSARPDGSMEVVKLYWFRHNCKDGQYSTAKVHRSVKVSVKDNVLTPTSVEDYEITLEPLPGLSPEVLEGV